MYLKSYVVINHGNQCKQLQPCLLFENVSTKDYNNMLQVLCYL